MTMIASSCVNYHRNFARVSCYKIVDLLTIPPQTNDIHKLALASRYCVAVLFEKIRRLRVLNNETKFLANVMTTIASSYSTTTGVVLLFFFFCYKIVDRSLYHNKLKIFTK